MNKTMKLSLATAMAVAGASALVACGGDSSTSSKNKNSSVNDYKELPSCTLKNDAEKATVDDDDAIYVCKDRKWEVLDTEFVANDTAKTLDDIPNCADEQDGNSYYIQKSGVNYICENERWEIVVVKKDEKSSSSTAKSSASKDDDKDDDKSSSSSAKSSSSTAKSSASKDDDKDDDKSSSSAAKSSSSTAKSSASKDDGKDDDKSSSSAEESTDPTDEKVGASLDKIPNCTEELEGEIYRVTDKNADYICTEERRWEKVLVCGSENYGEDSYFCVDGKAYETCGGKSYDIENANCVDGKIMYLSCQTWTSNMSVYEDGENVYLEEVTSGGYANDELGGCVAAAQTEEMFFKSFASTFGEKSIEEFKTEFKNEYLKYLIYFAGNGSADISNCDYNLTDKSFRKFDDSFTRQVLIEGLADLKKTCLPEGLPSYETKNMCSTTLDKSTVPMSDVEKKFCYEGKIYGRCGGETFETSSVYNPFYSSCIDGVVTKGASKCGGKYYDAKYFICYNNDTYPRALYEVCGESIADKNTEKCVDGKVLQLCGEVTYDPNDESVFCSGEELYSSATYGECGDGIYEKSKSFCYVADENDDGTTYSLCNGKTFTPHEGGVCAIDKNYYYTADSKTYFEDLRDGNVYRYESINGNLWMASDLIYAESGRDGINAQSRLYTSTELKEACPAGWNVPSSSNYEALLQYVGKDFKNGSSATAGGKLKSTSGWGSSTYNGTDDYGMAFKPTGLASSKTSDVSTINNGFWWTSTESGSDAYVLFISQSSNGASLTTRVTNYYFAMRCVKQAISIACDGRILSENGTGVCLADGTYQEMPEELYFVNEYVPMQTYNSLTKTFTGTATISKIEFTALSKALSDKNYKKSNATADGYTTFTFTKTVDYIGYGVTIKVPATASSDLSFEATVTAKSEKLGGRL